MSLKNVLGNLSSLFDSAASGGIQPLTAVTQLVGHVQTIAQKVEEIGADIKALRDNGASGSEIVETVNDVGSVVKEVVDTAAPVLPLPVAAIDGAIAAIAELAQHLAALRTNAQ